MSLFPYLNGGSLGIGVPIRIELWCDFVGRKDGVIEVSKKTLPNKDGLSKKFVPLNLKYLLRKSVS